MNPEFWISLFKDIPPELTVFLVSMIPIAELRAAIPIALGAFNFSILKTLLIVWVGNILPIVFIVFILEPLASYLSQISKTMKSFFNWLFERTRRKFEGRYKKYGKIALVLFVAIPLPLTGAWTGAVASFLFNIKPINALLFIFIGVFIASILVTIITQGVRFVF